MGEATKIIDRAAAELGMPSSIRGSFAGTAKVAQASWSTLPWLFLTALLAVYIILLLNHNFNPVKSLRARILNCNRMFVYHLITASLSYWFPGPIFIKYDRATLEAGDPSSAVRPASW